MSNRSIIREEVVKLNPIDDSMFVLMAKDRRFCCEILRVILQDNELELQGEPIPQYHVANPMGRKATLDAVCRLGSGQVVGIEIQKRREPDAQRRVRFESGLLSSRLTDPQTAFEDVDDIIFIYISAFDPFSLGKTVYYVDRVLRGLNVVVYNGLQEIYVNTVVKDGTDIAKLMEIFTEDDVYSEIFPITSEIKKKFKLTEEGRKEMTAVLEKLIEEERAEGIAQGISQGIAQGQADMLVSLVRDGILTVTQASERLGESEAEFQKRLNSGSFFNNLDCSAN